MRKIDFVLVIMPIVFQIGAFLFFWPVWVTEAEVPLIQIGAFLFLWPVWIRGIGDHVLISPYMCQGGIIMVVYLRIIFVLNRNLNCKTTRTTTIPQKGP